MTTLPQTSPMRAPRVGGNGHLAMPIVHGPAPAASHAMTGADVWRVIRGNIWLILITLVIAAIVGFLANMWLLARHSRYTANGLLSVRTTDELQQSLMSMGNGTNPASLEIEQRTHAKRLTHESLLATVLAKKEVRDTEWFKQFIDFRSGKQDPDIQAAKQDLLDHLDVIPQGSSRLIEVSMTYSVPNDCRAIVQALCDEYLSQSKAQQTAEQDERLHQLDQLVQSYEQKMNSAISQRDTLASTLGKSGVTVGGTNAKYFELQNLLEADKEYRRIANEYTWKLQQFKDGMSKGSSYELIRAKDANFRLASLKTRVSELEVDADAMADRGERSQNTMSLRLRLKEYLKQIEDLDAEISAQTAAEVQGEYTASAEGALTSMKQIDAKMEALRQEIADLAQKELAYHARQEEVRYFLDRRDKVSEEMDKIATVRSSSKFNAIEWAQLPATPDHPSFPKLWLVLSATMSIGLALSLGIAFLREMTDTTVRSPRDIARVGQMTLLGMIPHEADDPQVATGRLALAIFDSPNSITAEQFRHVRTRLQHAASLDTTRSILVSGCSPEDGKTTVACNIAAGLALNGRRILLVDANFRRPQLHTVFAVGNESGFGDVLNNAEIFAQSVRDTEVPNLSVMPSGNRPSNPTELLESQLLVDFIERALEEYDHVIFDSGPLLMVSDSIALAPRVDGVITVIRARGNSRGLLQRVRDELRRLKAEHLGVVLNAVRVQGGGYYGPMIKNYYAYQNR